VVVIFLFPYSYLDSYVNKLHYCLGVWLVIMGRFECFYSEGRKKLVQDETSGINLEKIMDQKKRKRRKIGEK